MKLLVIPDVHGRTFWKNPCQLIDEYDKVIFLGDYLDPYSFEGITVEEAISNFKQIIEFAKEHPDKVELLLGNHDMPYYSKKYLTFSMYHCRHSVFHHNAIAKLFKENKDMFKIATSYDDILFTHAGCTPGWLMMVYGEYLDVPSVKSLSDNLNLLLETTKGLTFLYMISEDRGGRDRYASCIWADASDTMWYQEMLSDPALDKTDRVYKLMTMKQVYGHTLQAYYGKNREILYGDALELENCKMLDNCYAYELDTENFTIIKVV